MLKQLATILIIFTCSWTAQSQVSLPFRKEAPIATDLYWTKAYDLLKDQRLAELDQLLEGLTQSSKGYCRGFDQAYEGLNEVFRTQNSTDAERALTEFITRSIVLEIYALNTISILLLLLVNISNGYLLKIELLCTSLWVCSSILLHHSNAFSLIIL